MKSKVFTAVVMFCLFGSSVLAADVKSDYDHDYDLSKLHSFRFADQSRRSSRDALSQNEIVTKRLHGAIGHNLQSIGMDQDSVQADFVIVYYAVVRQQTSINLVGRPRLGSGALWVDEYPEGTVVVEFRDARLGDLIWRGLVTDALDPSKSESRINNGVSKLVQRFAKDRDKQRKSTR